MIGVFDGQNRVKTESGHFDKYREVILERKKYLTPLIVSFASTSIAADSVKATVRVIATDSLRNADPRIFLIIFQDSMPYGLLGPLNFVCRRIVPPDTLGIRIPVDSLAPLDTFNINLSTANIWNTTKLGLISFIQDNTTKAIIQAVIKR